MSLQPIEDYSSPELQRLIESSPASQRYLSLIKDAPKNKSDEIRLFRHKHWLEATAATLFEKNDTRDICREWSHAADQILKNAWNHAGLAQFEMALFALGKLGAEELNLSSDVDLLVVAHSQITDEMLKAFRQFTKLLQESNELGFTLRLDFDLRPGGRFGGNITTVKQAENYYWTQGATWERLALVRLRAICGHELTISEFEEMTKKFSYRRYIDYSFLEDLKSLRAQIHHHYHNEDPDKFNLKLSVGGIRDIELFCHALQVIHGGKQMGLRTANTHDAYKKLIENKVYDVHQLEFLLETYWRYRDLENRLQLVNDEQTQIIDLNSQLKAELISLSTKVDGIVTQLLGRTAGRRTLPSSATQAEWLAKLGYSQRTVSEIWPRLVEQTAKSTRSAYDEEMRQEFLIQFVEALAKDGLDKDLGIHLLDDFIRATRAKAAFFSLFVGEPRLIRDIARLFSISPYLGGLVASRPELVDSFLLKAQSQTPANLEDLLSFLTEKRLLSEIFLAMRFLSDGDELSLGHELSQTADEITDALLHHLQREFHSDNLRILKLGKWGGRELGFLSDLDFVFLAKSTPTESDHKIAKRFVSRLTEANRGGMIYQIDLRLRPSGKAGPVVVQADGLLEFLKSQAEPWERQSYLRARIGHRNFEEQIRQAATKKGLESKDLATLKDIREKLLRRSAEVDIKYAPGGLLDIEFTSQMLTLSHRADAEGSSTQELFASFSAATESQKSKISTLTQNYSRLRKVEQLFRIVSQTQSHVLIDTDESFLRLSYLMKVSAEELMGEIRDLLRESRNVIEDLDPIYRGR